VGYVTNNLMSNEQVVHVGKVHWFIFVPSIVTLLIAIWVLNLDNKVLRNDIKSLIVFLLFVSFIIDFIRALISKISTELAVTTKRVIAKIGFISRKTVELNHNKVESFNVDQSIFGRIFNFGTITVCGTGGGKTPIPNISDPLEFRRQAMSIVDAAS
jgi:uncharacterized membrane protein YdbT with pleckstrin-like domain